MKGAEEAPIPNERINPRAASIDIQHEISATPGTVNAIEGE